MGDKQYKTIIRFTIMVIRCILKLFLFLNNIFLKKIKSNPIITNKLEITKGRGGVWLSKYPNLIPANNEVNVNIANRILVTIPNQLFGI